MLSRKFKTFSILNFFTVIYFRLLFLIYTENIWLRFIFSISYKLFNELCQLPAALTTFAYTRLFTDENCHISVWDSHEIFTILLHTITLPTPHQRRQQQAQMGSEKSAVAASCKAKVASNTTHTHARSCVKI